MAIAVVRHCPRADYRSPDLSGLFVHAPSDVSYDHGRLALVSLAGGELGALMDVAGVAGELADVQGLQFLTQASPGVGGYLVLGDPDEQQRQPAQQDVGGCVLPCGGGRGEGPGGS